jgi:LacI family transcriptional regulator
MTSDWRDGYAPGQAAIRSLIESGERPEALLCSNDDMAIGAIAACVAAGLRVPEDIAITGFDNTTAGRYACPPLTTVAQPTEAVAKKAVELLLKQTRGETISASEELVKLPCQLVVRQSCGNNQKQGR